MRKWILFLTILGSVPGLQAMEPEKTPELARVKPRAQDVALLQLLRGGYYAAASEMINSAMPLSRDVIIELRKNNRAQRVYRAALYNRYVNTVNRLIRLDLISIHDLDQDFGMYVICLEAKDGNLHGPTAKALITLLYSNAAHLIDLNHQFKYLIHYGRENVSGAVLAKAALRGYVPLVKAFLRAGANPNIKDGNGNTPLFLAIQNVHLSHADQMDVVRLLLADPAIDVEIENQWGRKVLQEAVKVKNHDVLLALIKKGANLNVVDIDDYTPLIQSVIEKDAEGARILLEHGADATLKSRYARTALDYAEMIEDPHINALIPLLKAKMEEQMEKK